MTVINKDHKKRDMLEVLADLPEMCATDMPSTGEPVLIKRGVVGYWPAPNIGPGCAFKTYEEFNDYLGVTEAQHEAMKAGSMFGFDVPAADPTLYIAT